MKKPIRVFYSTLSCRFYATRAWKQVKDHIEVTGDKFDVTDDICSAIFDHDIKITRFTPQPDGSEKAETR